uniref:E3 ubiquitin-protein ligase RNF14 n=1 Tax=Leptobrachium leishanense TaxID=445787 RepID=A0A8C5WI46_9ANUR
MSSEDRDAQEDELLALASIYPEDEFKRSETSQGGDFQVCLDLPPNFEILLKSNAATNILNERLHSTVSFLLPIVLNFELPSDYPSASPPNFTLSCKWLSPKQLARLCQHLDDLWVENAGCVVLFAWTQFLKEETLEHLCITSPHEIELCPNVCQDRIESSDTAECSSAACSREEIFDRRAIQDVESVSALIKCILDFNEAQQKKCFDSKSYMCNICFLEKLGSECMYFKVCHHVYCNICIKDYFVIQIKDGQVHSLNCPEPKCPSTAIPAQVKELVGEELFGRYDRLLLQSSLDLMPDVVYCPRPSCRTPVMQETSCNMGICPSCHYAFCTLCQMTYHGISKCNLPEENLDTELSEDLPEDDTDYHYYNYVKGEKETKEWLKKNTKNCPYCGVCIQKISGCNKMQCWKCQEYFCWLCMSILNKAFPSHHFVSPMSDCYKRYVQLFIQKSTNLTTHCCRLQSLRHLSQLKSHPSMYIQKCVLQCGIPRFMEFLQCLPGGILRCLMWPCNQKAQTTFKAGSATLTLQIFWNLIPHETECCWRHSCIS